MLGKYLRTENLVRLAKVERQGILVHQLAVELRTFAAHGGISNKVRMIIWKWAWRIEID